MAEPPVWTVDHFGLVVFCRGKTWASDAEQLPPVNGVVGRFRLGELGVQPVLNTNYLHVSHLHRDIAQLQNCK